MCPKSHPRELFPHRIPEQPVPGCWIPPGWAEGGVRSFPTPIQVQSPSGAIPEGWNCCQHPPCPPGGSSPACRSEAPGSAPGCGGSPATGSSPTSGDGTNPPGIPAGPCQSRDRAIPPQFIPVKAVGSPSWVTPGEQPLDLLQAVVTPQQSPRKSWDIPRTLPAPSLSHSHLGVIFLPVGFFPELPVPVQRGVGVSQGQHQQGQEGGGSQRLHPGIRSRSRGLGAGIDPSVTNPVWAGR